MVLAQFIHLIYMDDDISVFHDITSVIISMLMTCRLMSMYTCQWYTGRLIISALYYERPQLLQVLIKSMNAINIDYRKDPFTPLCQGAS